jgi:hypothetical protein
VQYAFTPADVVWLARLLTAASSGPYRGRRRAILWRALARFASSRRPGLSLAAFIQQLEPSLPRAPWGQLPGRARALALAAARGQLRRRHPNASVHVMPAGGYGSPGFGYGAHRSHGWSGESEFEQMEAAPPNPPAEPSAGPPAMGAPPSDMLPDTDAGLAPAGAEDMPADDDAAATEPPPMADEPLPAPASFGTRDGNWLDLNPGWLRRLLRSWRRQRGWWNRSGRRGGWGGPSWRTRAPYAGYRHAGGVYGRRWRSPAPGRVLVGRLRTLARNARRVGTLRSVRSGRRYPVFGGRVAGRNFRIIARPRGGLRHEIMAVRGSELQQELAR